MTEDRSIFAHIDELVAEEHALRSKLASGEISRDEERERLAELEVDLDRCWDLLRQRRARREFGMDPDEATPRSADTVEHYEQ